MLMCNVKGCTTNNFPLKIKANSVQKEASEFNAEFIMHILPKLEWGALVASTKELNLQIPEEIPKNANEDKNFLKSVHDVLIDLQIQEGSLICNNCSRAYPIANGVPNMLLNEDEV